MQNFRRFLRRVPLAELDLFLAAVVAHPRLHCRQSELLQRALLVFAHVLILPEDALQKFFLRQERILQLTPSIPFLFHQFLVLDH